MIKCFNCNQEINDADHYCSHCGYPQISDDILYHYTSLSTFEKIISNIQNGNIILRAYDAKTMNDPTDTQYLLDMLRNSYEFFCKKTYNSYIVSFSKLKDSLYMWNSYGDKGNGIAIGINKQKLFEASSNIEQKFHILCKLLPCHYWNGADINNNLQKMFGNSGDNLSDSDKKYISYLSCLIKDPDYISECEERIAVLDDNQYYTPFNIIKQDNVKNFIEISIPVSAIDTIVTGPCMDDNNRMKVSNLFCEKTGLIKPSLIRYRQYKP